MEHIAILIQFTGNGCESSKRYRLVLYRYMGRNSTENKGRTRMIALCMISIALPLPDGAPLSASEAASSEGCQIDSGALARGGKDVSGLDEREDS
jgi:hypothetical protein